MKIAIVLACLLAAAACGDDSPNGPSDGQNPPGDGSGSGSGSGEATLTSYVIDLVTHHTVATEDAKPYADFSSLPDPDGSGNDLTVYSSLF